MCSINIMYQSNRSFNIPPPQEIPRHLNFWKILVQIAPSLGQKAVQMPPPPPSPPWFINLHGISATRNMKLRLAIKFPTPYEWWSNALPPKQEKASNAWGMLGGCLSFDLTGTLLWHSMERLHYKNCLVLEVFLSVGCKQSLESIDKGKKLFDPYLT